MIATSSLYSISYATPIRFWNVKTGTLVQEMAAPDEGDGYRRIVLSHDWRFLATHTIRRDNEVQIWEVATGKRKASLTHDGHVNDLVLSPDGRYLATRTGSVQNEMVWVWDWMQGRPSSSLIRVTAFTACASRRMAPESSQEGEIKPCGSDSGAQTTSSPMPACAWSAT